MSEYPIHRANGQAELQAVVSKRKTQRDNEPLNYNPFEDSSSLFAYISQTELFQENIHHPLINFLNKPHNEQRRTEVVTTVSMRLWRLCAFYLLDHSLPENKLALPTNQTVSFFSRVVQEELKHDLLGVSGVRNFSDPHGVVVEHVDRAEFIKEYYKYRLKLTPQEVSTQTAEFRKNVRKYSWLLRYSAFRYIIPDRDDLRDLLDRRHLDYLTVPTNESDLRGMADLICQNAASTLVVPERINSLTSLEPRKIYTA